MFRIFVCLTIISFQSVCVLMEISFYSVLSNELLLSSVEQIRDSADGVFERPRDLLDCLISSVAGNTLTAMFLRLTVISSGFCWGQSLCLVCQLFSPLLVFSHAVFFLLSTFPFMSRVNATYHCHMIQFHLSVQYVMYISGRV